MPNAGDILTPTDQPAGLIKKHLRGTGGSVSGVTTETGFIRIDSIPIRNGYTYEVIAPRCCMTLSVATAVAVVRLRGSTSGVATTSSTPLDGGEIRGMPAADTTNVPEMPCIGYWDATTTGSLSVILTVARATASGSVGLFATSANVAPLLIKEIGVTPADSGTDL